MSRQARQPKAKTKFAKTFAEEMKPILRTYKTNHEQNERKEFCKTDLTKKYAE